MANYAPKLIVGFLVIIIGLSLIGVVAEQTNDATELSFVANETFNVASARIADGCMSINATFPYTVANAPDSGWQANGGCPLTDIVFRNQTRDVVTEGTDYLFFPTNGTFYLLNTTGYIGADCGDGPLITNVTEVDYTYCQDDYLDSSWGRSILNLVAGFFALALLGIGVGIFYSVAKDAKIL